jgi:hypothetical protein
MGPETGRDLSVPGHVWSYDFVEGLHSRWPQIPSCRSSTRPALPPTMAPVAILHLQSMGHSIDAAH